MGFAATCGRQKAKGYVFVFPLPMPLPRTCGTSRQHRDGVCTHNVVACAIGRRGGRRSRLVARLCSGQCAGVQYSQGGTTQMTGWQSGRRRPPHQAAAPVCGRGVTSGENQLRCPKQQGTGATLASRHAPLNALYIPACMPSRNNDPPSHQPPPFLLPGCLPPHHLLRAPSRSRHMGSSTPAHAAVAARRTPKNAGHPAALITSVSGHPANAAPV